MSLESGEYGAGYGHESESYEAEYPTGEADYEFDFPSEQHEAGESEAEVMEMEMASSLMELNSEQELEQFLGDMISKASSTIGDIARSPVGQALGGILKSAAKQALPMAGQALGTYLGGPAGGQIGSQLATKAGQMFGLEVEGLSHEDRDFEVTRQFVKFGSEAARRAAHEAKHRGGAKPAVAACRAADRQGCRGGSRQAVCAGITQTCGVITGTGTFAASARAAIIFAFRTRRWRTAAVISGAAAADHESF